MVHQLVKDFKALLVKDKDMQVINVMLLDANNVQVLTLNIVHLV